MTPKEEAKELVDKYYKYVYNGFSKKSTLYTRKKCALLAVSEFKSNSFDIESAIRMDFPSGYKTYEYWIEVEKEINNQ